jgi:hypothetical protein
LPDVCFMSAAVCCPRTHLAFDSCTAQCLRNQLHLMYDDVKISLCSEAQPVILQVPETPHSNPVLSMPSSLSCESLQCLQSSGGYHAPVEILPVQHWQGRTGQEQTPCASTVAEACASESFRKQSQKAGKFRIVSAKARPQHSASRQVSVLCLAAALVTGCLDMTLTRYNGCPGLLCMEELS